MDTAEPDPRRNNPWVQGGISKRAGVQLDEHLARTSNEIVEARDGRFAIRLVGEEQRDKEPRAVSVMSVGVISLKSTSSD